MDEAYKNKLWNEYAATKSSEVREQLILENPGIHSGSDPEDGLDSKNHPAEAEED